MPDFDWTASAIDALRQLWAHGHTTAEIGRRLRCTKNAVIGKARRLGLPPRSSPIRRGAPSADVRARTRAVPTTPFPRPALVYRPPVPSQPATLRALRTPEPLAPRTARPLGRAGLPRECCWPIGEPARPGFRFCGAATEPSCPYCEVHAARAYVRVRDREEAIHSPE